MKRKMMQSSRSGYLQIKFPDFLAAQKTLVEHRNIVRKLKQNSPHYRAELKTHFALLIFAKAHAFSLDTKTERRRLVNLIIKEIDQLRLN